MGTHSNQREEHTLVERKQSLFVNGFPKCMEIALVVLLRFGDDFDFDVFKVEHADNLSPAGHASAEQILGDLERGGHV